MKRIPDIVLHMENNKNVKPKMKDAHDMVCCYSICVCVYLNTYKMFQFAYMSQKKKYRKHINYFISFSPGLCMHTQHTHRKE